MRQKLKDLIAWKVNERKLREEQEFREFKRDEKHFIEIQKHKLNQKAKRHAMKSQIQKERTYKLLARGIPSHFYGNLHKAMT